MTSNAKKKSREKAAEIIVGLIAAAGGELRGKTRICKGFYFAHLFHFKKRHGILSAYPIVRLPYGPVIDNVDSILVNLARQGRIQITKRANGPYTEEVYKTTGAAAINKQELASLQEAAEFIKNKSAVDLSEMTHEHSRSWQTTPDGKEMDIYADLIDDVDFVRIHERQEEISDELASVFPSK